MTRVRSLGTRSSWLTCRRGSWSSRFAPLMAAVARPGCDFEPGQTGTVEIPVGELGRATGRLIQAPGVPLSAGCMRISIRPKSATAFASKDGLFELSRSSPARMCCISAVKGRPPLRSERARRWAWETWAAQHTQRAGGALNCGFVQGAGSCGAFKRTRSNSAIRWRCRENALMTSRCTLAWVRV